MQEKNNRKKLFGIFSLSFLTYIRYTLVVILMYVAFAFISLYIPYLLKGTIQNLLFWFFLIAIFDQVFIAIENFIIKWRLKNV